MNDADVILERLRRYAWLLDNSLRLPGTRFRVGLDAVLGLVPGLGDAAGMVLSSYIVHQAWRLGVPRSVLLRMGLNIVIEGLVGAIPLAGDVFDAVWKANVRNVVLLEAQLLHPRRTASASTALMLSLGVIIIVLVAGAVGVFWFVLHWLTQAGSA